MPAAALGSRSEASVNVRLSVASSSFFFSVVTTPTEGAAVGSRLLPSDVNTKLASALDTMVVLGLRVGGGRVEGGGHRGSRRHTRGFVGGGATAAANPA